MVLLSFPAANRDPDVFPEADKVIIDRKENRHAALASASIAASARTWRAWR
jgi:cytochrome P450